MFIAGSGIHISLSRNQPSYLSLLGRLSHLHFLMHELGKQRLELDLLVLILIPLCSSSGPLVAVVRTKKCSRGVR